MVDHAHLVGLRIAHPHARPTDEAAGLRTRSSCSKSTERVMSRSGILVQSWGLPPICYIEFLDTGWRPADGRSLPILLATAWTSPCHRRSARHRFQNDFCPGGALAVDRRRRDRADRQQAGAEVRACGADPGLAPARATSRSQRPSPARSRTRRSRPPTARRRFGRITVCKAPRGRRCIRVSMCPMRS